ncbi:MAG: metallophosphoesterase [Geoalkalibacter sp.]|uniref:metallophosphoesterase n=1 Tax=Geoalkalibacter sp. TaxID=3041440 RepID=UPI002A9B7433|nr:metallophosphoesterase [Thermodesulfobacteriota bacterium]
MKKTSSPDTQTIQPDCSHRRLSRRTFLALNGAGAFTLLSAHGLVLEPRSIVTETLSLPMKKLRAGQELNLVHISDLHIEKFSAYHQDVIRRVNTPQADVILITGDFIGEERNLAAVRNFLRQLKASHGIFAVQGNWEYWGRVEGKNLQRAFSNWGIELLINQRRDIHIDDLPLSIAGLDYPSATDALNTLHRRMDPARLNLLMSHVPAFEHHLLDDRIDLVLAGHTHGGQIRLPLLPPPHLPRFSDPFVDGLYHVGPGIPLYVTRGVGTSVLPLRLFCPPEITRMTLHGSSGSFHSLPSEIVSQVRGQASKLVHK